MKKLCLAILTIGLWACQQSPTTEEKNVETEVGVEVELNGEAQGTTYTIKYLDQEERNFKSEVDSLLAVIDFSMSTYNQQSLITAINKAGSDTTFEMDDLFAHVIQTSWQVNEATDGAFDATVAPLVYAWGFSFDSPTKLDSATVDSLLQFTGLQQFDIQEKQLQKKLAGARLDFNAIAQGYSVDLIADLLKSKGLTDFMVELGGEVVSLGKNKDRQFWRLGVDRPEESYERTLQAIIGLENQAMATSGNYRKFYEIDGQRYSHTIDPSTGYPVQHSLLSATVITDRCDLADAYATAFMVMGLEKSKSWLAEHPEVQAYLIYAGEEQEFESFISEKLQQQIEVLN